MPIQFPLYQVFHRTWWKENPDYPDGLEPDSKAQWHHIDWFDTEKEATYAAKRWNKNHAPGRLSRKAEYTKWIEEDFQRAYQQYVEDFDPTPDYAFDGYKSCPDYDTWLYDFICERTFTSNWIYP